MIAETRNSKWMCVCMRANKNFLRMIRWCSIGNVDRWPCSFALLYAGQSPMKVDFYGYERETFFCGTGNWVFVGGLLTKGFSFTKQFAANKMGNGAQKVTISYGRASAWTVQPTFFYCKLQCSSYLTPLFLNCRKQLNVTGDAYFIATYY